MNDMRELKRKTEENPRTRWIETLISARGDYNNFYQSFGNNYRLSISHIYLAEVNIKPLR